MRSECFGRIAEKLTVAPQPPAGCDRMPLAHVSPTPRMLAEFGILIAVTVAIITAVAVASLAPARFPGPLHRESLAQIARWRR